MSSKSAYLCTAFFGLLAGGCRSEYLVNPELYAAARGVAAKSDDPGERSQRVAVFAYPIDDEAQTAPNAGAPRQYLKLSAMRVDSPSPTGFWRVSTRKRGAFLAGGGVLLGLGLASVLGGGLIIHADQSTPNCLGDGCSLKGLGTMLFGIPALAAGIAELIPGSILLALASPRVEVPEGERGIFYVDESIFSVPAGTVVPSSGSPAAAAPPAVGVGVRF